MPRYLTRLVVVLVLGLTIVLWLRSMLVPRTFGEFGHYRGAALGEIASQQPLYAGREACEKCHQDVVAVKSQGRHASLPCEVCHGASGAHARNPASMKPFTGLDRTFCLRCHDQSLSRPAGFPMVDGMTHNQKEDCRKCHSPHSPSLNP